MQIELSKHEVEMIDKALTHWENAATQEALMGTMLSAMLSTKESRQESKGEAEREMKSAEVERDSRRRKATMLRAKLFQAESRESEYLCSPDAT